MNKGAKNGRSGNSLPVEGWDGIDGDLIKISALKPRPACPSHWSFGEAIPEAGEAGRRAGVKLGHIGGVLLVLFCAIIMQMKIKQLTLEEFRELISEKLIIKGITPPVPGSEKEQEMYQKYLKGLNKLVRSECV